MRSTTIPLFTTKGLLHISQIKNLPHPYSRKSYFLPIFDESQLSNLPDAKFYTFYNSDSGEIMATIKPGCVLIGRPQDIISQIHRNASGLLTIHSTDKNIAFALNENCDPTVRSDMIQGLDRIVDEKVKLHDVICNSITFPSSSRDLGTWQGLYTINIDKKPSKNSKILSTTLKSTKTWKTKINTTRGSNKMNLPSDLTKNGVLHALTLHTSCSLALITDSEAANRESDLSKTVPEKWNDEFFEHTYEGPDDMPAHLKCAIQGAEASVAVVNGKIVGDESFFLVEHRDSKKVRTVVFCFFESE